MVLITQIRDAWNKATAIEEKADELRQLLEQLNEDRLAAVDLDAATKTLLRNLYLTKYDALKSELQTLVASLP